MSRKSQLQGWTDDRDVALSAKLADTDSPTLGSGSPSSASKGSPFYRPESPSNTMKSTNTATFPLPIASSAKKSSMKSVSPNKSSLEQRLFSDKTPTTFSRRNSSRDESILEEVGKMRGGKQTPGATTSPFATNQSNFPSSVSTPAIKTPAPSNAEKKSQKQMTKAERRALQEKQRAEKAAKMEAAANGNEVNKKRDGTSAPKSALDAVKSIPALGKAGSMSSLDQIKATKPKTGKKQAKDNVIESGSLFTHLNQYEKHRTETIEAKAQSHQVHPMIHSLGLQYAQFDVVGGNARCLAMLLVFKKLIMDYTTPSGITLQRHLTTYVGKQIDFLNTTRALATSMKHAIRFVKNEIATLSIDLPDEDAKVFLCERIEEYIQQRIVFPMKMIKEQTATKISSGDRIMTFGCSSTVYQVLEHAKQKGLQFSVVVVDARPKLEGKQMLRQLTALGIPCTYMLVNAIGTQMKKMTKVIIGASSVLSNGAIMSRAGTAAVAMMAHEFKVPVIVCAETYKFSEAVRLDSFVSNEIGDPFEVARVPNHPDINQLDDWQSVDKLSVLNLHYDVTPSQYIAMVSCEQGFISSTSVPTVLREMGQIQQLR